MNKINSFSFFVDISLKSEKFNERKQNKRVHDRYALRNFVKMRKESFLLSVCVSLKFEKFDEKQNKKMRDLLKQ